MKPFITIDALHEDQLSYYTPIGSETNPFKLADEINKSKIFHVYEVITQKYVEADKQTFGRLAIFRMSYGTALHDSQELEEVIQSLIKQ